MFANDHYNYLLYIILIFVTALMFAISAMPSTVLGIMGLVWSFFGFYRFLFFLPDFGDSKKSTTTLTGILLKTLRQQKSKVGKHILQSVSRNEVIIWLGLSVIFVVWMIFQTLYPTAIPVIDTFYEKTENLLSPDNLFYRTSYHLMTGISYCGLIGIIIFSGLSFGYSNFSYKWGVILTLPAIAALGVYICLHSSKLSAILFPDLLQFSGGGWGATEALSQLSSRFMTENDSFFLQRYIEGGSIAAYGLYIIFIPMTFNFCQSILKLKLPAFLGVFLIISCIFVDLTLSINQWHTSFYCLALSLISLCWGYCLRRES